MLFPKLPRLPAARAEINSVVGIVGNPQAACDIYHSQVSGLPIAWLRFPKLSEQTFRDQDGDVMTGFGRRLLAAFALIFFLACLLVRAQELVPALAPPPDAKASRYSPPVETVRPPLPPIRPGVRPLGPGTLPFDQIAAVAGIIFSGRVTSIGQSAGLPGHETASTTVTFQVEQAMRGVSPGQSLTIHEWPGLWNGGERYRVGERVLLFLYLPSKFGLTSPVSGGLGRFAMDSHGMVLLNPRHVAALSGDPVLGGKTSLRYADFSRAVERSRPEN